MHANSLKKLASPCFGFLGFKDPVFILSLLFMISRSLKGMSLRWSGLAFLDLASRLSFLALKLNNITVQETCRKEWRGVYNTGPCPHLNNRIKLSS